jgi:2'-5' RNA ligase/GNAT superfamily N-acetyltransferase
VTELVLGDEPVDWPITIGVALPIPEPFLGELGAYRERFGDPLAHAIVAHITLVPPMQVSDEAHLAAILDHLRDTAAELEPFDMVLAGAGTFRPVSQVVFVPVEEGEPEVRAAEAMIRRGPLDRALSFPYHPHVTVAHDLDEDWLDQAHAAMATYRAAFTVDRLALFIQGQDSVWRPSVVFPFGEQLRNPERYAGDALTVDVVDAAQFPDLCEGLGAILAESVASGAGVNILLPLSAADGAAWWRDQAADVASGCRIVLVARVAGALVGTISLTPAAPPNDKRRAELTKLLVNAADRRRGVATRLMAAAESEARRRGFRLLTLDCVAGGPDEELYRGLGYVSVGTIPGFALSPAGEPEGATFMYLALH